MDSPSFYAVNPYLGRLLTKEERISDLIAFLASLDAAPLLKLLDLKCDNPRFEREETVSGEEGDGRVDLMVYDGCSPVALIEVKAASSQHGQQFEVYEAWSAALANRQVPCFAFSLDDEIVGLPRTWTHIALTDVLNAWNASDHPHASWLGAVAATALQEWVSQSDRTIGHADNSLIADLVVRRTATRLEADAENNPGSARLIATGGRDSGGKASLTVFAPFPGYPSDSPSAWLCIDVRAGARALPTAPWSFRCGVHVDAGYAADSGDARSTAHDLALSIREAMTHSALTSYLKEHGRDDLAKALSVTHRGGAVAGLRREPTPARLDEWKADMVSGAKTRAHPLFFHDWGRRLASLMILDPSVIDRQQLQDLVRHAMNLLLERSAP